MDKYKGIILATAGIEIANKEKTENLIFKQLQQVQAGNISEFELDASKKSLINMLKSLNDSQRSIQTFYLGQMIANSEETIESFVEKLSNVQKEDVVQQSQRIKPHTIYFLNGKTGTEV